MIGPAARRHFYKALAAAGQAEMHIGPGGDIERTQFHLAHAQLEMIKGVAFAFLAENVSFRVEETDEPK